MVDPVASTQSYPSKNEIQRERVGERERGRERERERERENMSC